MGLVINEVSFAPNIVSEIIIKIAIGVLLFTLWSLFTWNLFKKPEGLESTAIEYLSRHSKKLSAKSKGKSEDQ